MTNPTGDALAALTPNAGRVAFEARFARQPARNRPQWDKLDEGARAIWAEVEAAVVAAVVPVEAAKTARVIVELQAIAGGDVHPHEAQGSASAALVDIGFATDIDPALLAVAFP